MKAAASMCFSFSMPQARPGEHAEQGAQPFSATTNDVFGDLVDQRHGTLEPCPDHGVYTGEIGANQRPDLLEGHGRGIDGTGAGTAGGQRGDFGAHSGR
jgi:hypothetical protein